MIRIGTSGYNHRDWIGPFYPQGLGPARYLARYAEEFDLCEWNAAVAHIPGREEAERVLRESEERVHFMVLAPRGLVAAVPLFTSTRDRTAPVPPESLLVAPAKTPPLHEPADRHGWGGTAPARTKEGRDDGAVGKRSDSLDGLLVRLREALRPFSRAGRFGGLVLPLPSAAAATPEALVMVARCQDLLEDLPLLLEPRAASWVEKSALDFLREAGIGFVLSDGPDPAGPSFGPDRGKPRPLPARLRPFAPVTAKIACVRLHGRDGETRWAGGSARRDYLYSWEELVGWLPALRALAARAEDLHIVFNNPWRGRALDNARMMKRLIGPAADFPARPRRAQKSHLAAAPRGEELEPH